ncbi:DNA (cytosine-5-)-methyltransferase [Candidatus Kaiserbacteria bacterium RIFCSPLOWO2_02_FULL_54_13]|uniref:Cytosine-specific methyltransferase n=1 Tax=Candidatus Kaiserbacteria bacterium RIFCSPHIGHO2_02_FULL_54_22 TaxID=1798495 RepID=A0A1F6DJH7_9BACT|nr:MAG: DNA (cytosine-5-)-methyltransferase [Candidatus Kaiserbacteria bacterium RIFCSPHIGHO2_02_FULL_54_22]OGG69011.1 MAG: DNA (cytosine-5-)-methyltransferase [Candidatus Kaiserbacteria bacterium RIFCSPHIGHO2_12_FULL_54_16]OGG83151.1 MAG: DNA (cytosine-5-)-methyltransferase [Candidatus Kaiserbacteria bacterium RIFCSPLOWO2_02_FULL_54_13]
MTVIQTSRLYPPILQTVEDTVVFKYGELFSGPGGLALGANKARVQKNGVKYQITHAWAADYDDDSCETCRKNIAPENPESVICQDVKNLDIEALGPIDAFAYGFPCNDFSIVGEQKGFDGSFGPLYTYGLKVINRYRPKFFVAENVSGLASANDGNAFETILRDLASSGNGYEITAHRYKAEEYGVPQTRHRIIIVGIDKSFNLQFKVPAPTHRGKYVSAREALENPKIMYNAPNHEFKRQSPIVVERLKMTLPGENAWTANLPDHLKLNVKSARMSQIYRRLHPDKPSYTITASGGGGTHGYHYAEPRALTNRERARIQTFPDDFVFSGSIESVRKQIGMAVPPLLSEIIFTSILKTFANVEYDAMEANLFTNTNTKLL